MGTLFGVPVWVTEEEWYLAAFSRDAIFFIGPPAKPQYDAIYREFHPQPFKLEPVEEATE